MNFFDLINDFATYVPSHVQLHMQTYLKASFIKVIVLTPVTILLSLL